MRFTLPLLLLAALGTCVVTGCSDSDNMRQVIESVNMSTDVTAEDVDAAIEYAKLYTTKTEKVAYLIKQGRTFYQNQDYKGALELAQYILDELDPNSKMAQELLNAAKEKSAEVLKDTGVDVGGFMK
ncbi:MAG: hypothetical protein CMF48_04730 [Legionellales bacterium]|nr:hypothetical protein [Legionellales bacterium]